MAAHTRRLSLAAGSAVFPLRHPIDLAKQSASIDQLSGGRLVLGAASGDRGSEFPAYGIDHSARAERYRETFHRFRELTQSTGPRISSALGRRGGGLDVLPKPSPAGSRGWSPGPRSRSRSGSPNTPTAGWSTRAHRTPSRAPKPSGARSPPGGS
nr:LLM class flavin-dependent oxidoreductase [Streptomyces aureocirculatus]